MTEKAIQAALETDFTSTELKQFDRLTLALSDRDQLRRITARFRLKEFIAAHGQQKCDAMFAKLKARDAKKGRRDD